MISQHNVFFWHSSHRWCWRIFGFAFKLKWNWQFPVSIPDGYFTRSPSLSFNSFQPWKLGPAEVRPMQSFFVRSIQIFLDWFIVLSGYFWFWMFIGVHINERICCKTQKSFSSNFCSTKANMTLFSKGLHDLEVEIEIRSNKYIPPATTGCQACPCNYFKLCQIVQPSQPQLQLIRSFLLQFSSAVREAKVCLSNVCSYFSPFKKRSDCKVFSNKNPMFLLLTKAKTIVTSV